MSPAIPESMGRLWEMLLPPPAATFAFCAGGIVFAGAALWGCGWLRARQGVRANYTRKIFHILIFSAAMGLQVAVGLPALNAAATGVVTVVMFAVWRGDRHPMFEALARPEDAPRRRLLIIAPLLTTALGGLTANALAGKFALVGYLVCGWGDAAGEPIGVRFGRHKYQVPSLPGPRAVRSLEGSAAVGIVSLIAAYVALNIGLGGPVLKSFIIAMPVAIVAVGLEAFSPHGTDNFAMIAGPAWFASVLDG